MSPVTFCYFCHSRLDSHNSPLPGGAGDINGSFKKPPCLKKKKNGEKGNKAINKCQMFWACRHYVTNEKKKEIKKGNKYKIE